MQSLDMDNVFGRRQLSDEQLAQIRTRFLSKGSGRSCGRSRERGKTPRLTSYRDEVACFHGMNTWKSPMKLEQVLPVKGELKELEVRGSPVKRRPRKTPDPICLPIVVEDTEEEAGHEVIPQQEQVLLVKGELKELEVRGSAVMRRPHKTPDPTCSLPIVVEEPEEEAGHEVIPQQEQVLPVKGELKEQEVRGSPVMRRPRKTPDATCSLPIVVEEPEEEADHEVIPQQEQVLPVKGELKELEVRGSPVKRRPRKTPDATCSLPIVVEEPEEESSHEVIPQQEQVLPVKGELKELEVRGSPVMRRPRKTPDPTCSLPIVVEEPEEESSHEVIPQVPEATEPTRKSKWWSRNSPRVIERRVSNSVASLNIEGPAGGARRLRKSCSRLVAALARLLCFRSCCGELEE